MFEIGWSELMLIGIVALVVIGPKELPATLRTLGQWMGKVRKMASEFQGQFHEAMREAEVDQLKKDMDDVAAKAAGYTAFDPIAEARADIERTIGDLPPADQIGSKPPEAAASNLASPAHDDPIAAIRADLEASDALPPAGSAAVAEPPLPTASPQAPTSAPAQASPQETATADAKPQAGKTPA